MYQIYVLKLNISSNLQQFHEKGTNNRTGAEVFCKNQDGFSTLIKFNRNPVFGQ